MRCALAGEVGQKEEAFATSGDICRFRQETVEFEIRSEGILIPLQTAGSAEHHSHEMPGVGYSMAEGVQTTFAFVGVAAQGREDNTGCAYCDADLVRCDAAHADSARRLIATSSDDWRSRFEAGRCRTSRADCRGDRCALVGRRHPLGGNLQRLQNFGPTKPVRRH